MRFAGVGVAISLAETWRWIHAWGFFAATALSRELSSEMWRRCSAGVAPRSARKGRLAQREADARLVDADFDLLPRESPLVAAEAPVGLAGDVVIPGGPVSALLQLALAVLALAPDDGDDVVPAGGDLGAGPVDEHLHDVSADDSDAGLDAAGADALGEQPLPGSPYFHVPRGIEYRVDVPRATSALPASSAASRSARSIIADGVERFAAGLRLRCVTNWAAPAMAGRRGSGGHGVSGCSCRVAGR